MTNQRGTPYIVDPDFVPISEARFKCFVEVVGSKRAAATLRNPCQADTGWRPTSSSQGPEWQEQ